MKTIVSILKARWFLTLLGALALALLVWLVGPLVAIADLRPLESDIARLVVALIILVIWGAGNIIALKRANKADAALVDGIVGGGAEGGVTGGASEEITALKERLEEAVRLLKQSDASGRWGRRYLYQLPWYLMIGPPGSGKTTAINNSELVKRMAGKRGRAGVPGVGGTRQCEWLFTEEAVLIDTAGRYTTQDSDALNDAAAWGGFLNLLKTCRARQPINGVFVAVSALDLVGSNDAERSRHARIIRERLDELHVAFGISFPVYLLLTKLDLLSGFTEFFDDLGKREREQTWGMTFPFEPPENLGALFCAEFDLLVDALTRRTTTRLQQEPDLGRRGAVFGFPAQFISLRETVQAFLDETFEYSRYDTRPRLRGVYFTSGTQEGSPVDRLAGNIARMIGAEQSILPPRPGTGRSYFLTGLLRDVVFPEAGIVAFNPKIESRRRWTAAAIYSVSALALAGSISAWAFSYMANEALLKEAQTAVDNIASEFAAIPSDAAGLQRFDAILPPLNTLRHLASKDRPAPALSQGFGLYQGDAVREAAEAAYRRALNALLVPVMTYRVEMQIRNNLQNTDYLYEALKIYLMLTGQHPGGGVDREFLRQWQSADWASVYRAPADAAIRQALIDHLDTLLTGSVKPMGPDTRLVDQVRLLLANFPLASRAYAHIKQSPEVRKLAEWRPIDAAGPTADRVFVRPSGKLLSNGIPGLFTRSGFYTAFLPSLPGAVGNIAKESWVIGNQPSSGLIADDSKLERDVLQLYLNDYISQWDGVLTDLALTPMLSLDDAMRVAGDLSGPTSPLRNLLTAVATETALAAGQTEGLGQAKALTAIVGAANVPGAGALGNAVNSASIIGGAVPQPGKPVDDHFKALHNFVNNKTNVAGGNLDDVMRMMGDLYLQLSRLKGGARLTDVMGVQGPTPTEQLAAAAARAPAVVAPLLAQVGKSGSSATVGNAKAELGALWNASIRRHCEQITNRRFPFDRRSDSDAPLRDFGELFKPNGQLDTFFMTHLQRFADTSQPRWRWQKVDGVDLGISGAVLAQFQRAAAVRDTLFSNPVVPSVRFDLLPVALPPGVAQVTLEIDGQIVQFQPGQARPTTLQWPGVSAAGMASVTITPSAAEEAAETVSFNGPWALFRLVDRSRPTPAGSPESVRITVGAVHPVSFVLRANTINNPFTLQALAEFQCPGNF